MDNTFDALPSTSRIWIYQGSRPLTPNEKTEILKMAIQFTGTWSAHGNDLQAGATILHDQFLVLSVNEEANGASGCSIDKAFKFIQVLESDYGISWLDRSKLAFIIDNEVYLTPTSELKLKIDTGTITKDTLIFNNLVDKKGDLEHKWIIPAKDSWIKKYFRAN
jgi:hypothetical protein